MKTLSKVMIGIIVLLAVPFFASAQAVNTSASTQQAFLTELQSLQQELASLEATITAMIAAAGGSVATPTLAGATLATQATTSVLPILTPTSLGTSLGAQQDFSGEDLSSALIQALASSVNATSSFAVAARSAATTTGSSTTTNSTQNIATQFDPSCVSSLFANGAQCGGLYYCGSGSAAYWSATACVNGQ